MLNSHAYFIPDHTEPDRADKLLSLVLPGAYSRAYVARLLRKGLFLLRGEKIRPSQILNSGDCIEFIEDFPEQTLNDRSEVDFAGLIVFEDAHVLVIDKPAGLVVHPGPGHSTGTLVDALLRARPEIEGVGEPGRWGVVHRLDRFTSGVMVLAKTVLSHETLSSQFKLHSVTRVYLALVRGSPTPDSGIVNAPLGRHVKDRKRISVATKKGRNATTRWQVRQRLGSLTLLEARPQTGRTHQIRVHLASIGLPVLGDGTYGRMRHKSSAIDSSLKKYAALVTRQCLHASKLGFRHPIKGHYIEFESPLPDDMVGVITSAAHDLGLPECGI